MNIVDELRKRTSENRILVDEPMRSHTYFQIGGIADYLVIPGAISELAAVQRFAENNDIPVLVIGNGSNLLVRDGGIRGIIIQTTDLRGFVVNEDIIRAECGITLEDLANVALENGLSGLEFASGIPGTLGGAVVMNAGAYNGEMKDIILESQYINEINELKVLPFEKHFFGYRTSIYQNIDATVVSATLKLHQGKKTSIKVRMDDLRKQRWEKQPMDQPSGGSVFKRPEGSFVGKLIDDCGLRGTRMGDAMISDKHCGFIVNLGNATAKDVLALIKHAQDTVLERFNVKLELELRVVGEE
jgi:UDP-N-acetylmuramate dehydrogenase